MKRNDCLATAETIVNKDKVKEYGDAYINFQTIADFWTAYLDIEITKNDVVNMMILLKIARAKNGEPKDDTYVDICGYASLGAEFQGEEQDVHDILKSIMSAR